MSLHCCVQATRWSSVCGCFYALSFVSLSFSIQYSFHHFHLPSFLSSFLPSFLIISLNSLYLALVDPAAAAAAVPTDPTAYYTDYWLYASYYGEAAARLYYTQWSPPEGTLPPPGTVLPPIDVRYATLYLLPCKPFNAP